MGDEEEKQAKCGKLMNKMVKTASSKVYKYMYTLGSLPVQRLSSAALLPYPAPTNTSWASASLESTLFTNFIRGLLCASTGDVPLAESLLPLPLPLTLALPVTPPSDSARGPVGDRGAEFTGRLVKAFRGRCRRFKRQAGGTAVKAAEDEQCHGMCQ